MTKRVQVSVATTSTCMCTCLIGVCACMCMCTAPLERRSWQLARPMRARGHRRPRRAGTDADAEMLASWPAARGHSACACGGGTHVHRHRHTATSTSDRLRCRVRQPTGSGQCLYTRVYRTAMPQPDLRLRAPPGPSRLRSPARPVHDVGHDEGVCSAYHRRAICVPCATPQSAMPVWTVFAHLRRRTS